MTNKIVFMLEIICMILVMVAILGSLYIKLFIMPELERLREGNEHLAAELVQLQARQKVYEKRLMKVQVPEKVVFLNGSKKSSDVKFGGF